MGLYKRKNIVIGAIGRLMFPEALWTRRFRTAWFGSLLTILSFNLLWSLQCNLMALAYVGTYINGILLATLLTLPAVCSRRQWPQLIVLLVVDVVLIANLMYCQTYFSSIPLSGYAHLSSATDLMQSASTSFSWWYLILPAIAIATFLLMNPGEDTGEPRPNIVFYLMLLGVIAIVAGLTTYFNGGLTHHVHKLRSGYDSAVAPVVYTVPGVLIAESLTPSNAATHAQQQFAASWGRNHVALRSDMGEPADTLMHRDNLVVIFWESLESWPVEATVEGKELTPNLNRVLRDTTISTFYAPRVLSQAAVGRITDGMLLTLAGMYPTTDEAFAMACSDNSFHTLPDAMKQHGAQTYLLCGDRPWRWNISQLAKSFGIDHLHLRDSWNTSECINGSAPSDNAVISQAIAKMQRGEVWPEGETAYVQINTLSGRAPFKIPAELQTIQFDGVYPTKLRDYMIAVHYTDQTIGRLLDYLRSRSDWPRTLVVVMGDHQALAQWRPALRSDAAGSRLVNPEEYVPFAIINAPIPGRRKDVMGQVDIYPTILDEMGMDYAWRGMGFSAVALRSPRFAVTPRGRVVGDTSGFNNVLVDHIKNAPTVSRIALRNN